MSMFYSTCLDEYCHYRIIFPADLTKVVCWGCGQTHNVENLLDKKPVEGLETNMISLVTDTQTSNHIRASPETIKVLGVSNYHHKLLSHLLTSHGMDKETGKAKPLKELLQMTTFDCSVFGDRCFSIEERHLNISGYGRDESGSASYLADTLALLLPYNENIDTLVPLHADGDGHCLVHAVSRALVGRELFWHPLRVNLKKHFKDHLDTYEKLLGDFVNKSEWSRIIEECDPNFASPDGIDGLRPIHVFGLANVLRRPILLLDSVAGMQSCAEYAALYLPGLFTPDKCCNKEGQLNPPLCIAWSSGARNHYIPLVPVKERPLPQIPKTLLPKVWLLPQSALEQYLKFNEKNCVLIGGEKSVQTSYILQLTRSMDDLFISEYGVDPQLVTDVYIYHYKYKNTGMRMMSIVDDTSSALNQHRLQRCLECHAVNRRIVSEEWLRPRGFLYMMAQRQYGLLMDGRKYPFHIYGVTCTYNAQKDLLEVDSPPIKDNCTFCSGQLRTIHPDGTVAYEDGDITIDPVKNPANRCPCGFKHWWKGMAYDNPPVEVTLLLKWKEVSVTDTIHWFQYEASSLHNSNAHQVAAYLIQKHFPGEFGSQPLQQSIVNQILEKVKECEESLPKHIFKKIKIKESETKEILQENLPLTPPDESSTDMMDLGSKKDEASGWTNPPPSPVDLQRDEISSSTETTAERDHRKGPAITMLSSTPLQPDKMAMDRFMDLMKR
ncbi:deubiquitinating protein VCPIP1-like [Macrosteles quadrilineatus]|uniref:deubiquitinating protein VCPIP1-like n=1 Tax=Macrosteles quadrilineatus TaxID=74068 RepID=UPI0023E13988|nr:deubiquitinating protein VCPIP1-like [Macrosteles quadrilineatus]